MTGKNFATLADFREQEIEAVLGEFKDGYDVEGIAVEACEWSGDGFTWKQEYVWWDFINFPDTYNDESAIEAFNALLGRHYK